MSRLSQVTASSASMASIFCNGVSIFVTKTIKSEERPASIIFERFHVDEKKKGKTEEEQEQEQEGNERDKEKGTLETFFSPFFQQSSGALDDDAFRDMIIEITGKSDVLKSDCALFLRQVDSDGDNHIQMDELLSFCTQIASMTPLKREIYALHRGCMA